MNDLQMKYRAGEIAPEDYIHELERRLAESESNVQALVAAQVDAVLESQQTTPLLLRQAQLALQRSNELLEQRVTARTAALAESELKYRSLFQSIDEGFCIIQLLFDQTGKPVDYLFLEANPVFERQAGFQAPAGVRMREIAPNHEQHWFDIYGKVATTGEPVRFENTAAQQNRVFDVFAFRIGDPAERKVAVLFNDITERKQIENALRTSEKNLREIMESITDGLAVLDRNWVYTYMNDTGARIIQRKPEDLLGGYIWNLYPHSEGTRFFSGYHEAMETGQPVHFEEYYPEPLNMWLECHCYPYQDGLAVYFRNVTERKAAADALNRYAAQLEQLNRELAFANRELKDFASIASHDLQEPLRKVKQFGKMLQKHASAALAREDQEYLDRMLDAAQRMQDMITELLDYSRINIQGNPFTQVDLAQIAREVLSDLDVRIEQTAGTVEIGELPVIEADPLHMRQLFQNLIGNALKFYNPGAAPVVKVRAEDGKMEGSGEEALCIHFQDNGIGIPEQYLEKLFQPFMRLHGRSQYEGTGMGLAICRKITERHGGTITATSLPGEGTTFIVMLPKRQRKGTDHP